MKKAFILLMSIILLTGFIIAAPVALSPTCKINAQITNVISQEAHSCKYYEERTLPAMYLLNVTITKISTIDNGDCYITNEGNSSCKGTCEELYPINSEQTLTIYKSQINNRDINLTNSFIVEETLEGNIHLTGDKCTRGIYLSDYIINTEEEPILGASCGTVTPDTQNECCVNKGYSGWNKEEWECTNNTNNEENNKNELNDNKDNKNELNDSQENENDEEKECEAWKCTNWSACLNETKTRKCTKVLFNCTKNNEKPQLKKNCSEKEELKFYDKLDDCPEGCICSGSSTKCAFENGTRVMTIYAGKSGNIIVQIKNLNMSTNVTLYKDSEGKLYGIFKGNKTHSIMLPDDIKERMQNKTKIKLENESINLDEEGQYNMNATKRTKLFSIFPVKERVEFSINSETGEIIKTKIKWWGFLAKDIKEEQ